MGLMTCDVTGLGVVVTIDRQPTLIGDRSVEPQARPLDRKRLIGRASSGFSGFITAVGTEVIGDLTTTTFLEQHGLAHADKPLAEYAARLASDLSQSWRDHDISTGLYVHISGVLDGEPMFFIVNNIGGMEELLYVDINTEFKAVNDLDDNLVPLWAGDSGESKMELLSRMIGYLRNGTLQAVLEPFDDFNSLMSKLYAQSYPGFARPATIQEYGSLVRMRSEFVKRIFNKSKGLYTGVAPTDGPVDVVAVDLDGQRWEITVKDGIKPLKDQPRWVR